MTFYRIWWAIRTQDPCNWLQIIGTNKTCFDQWWKRETLVLLVFADIVSVSRYILVVEKESGRTFSWLCLSALTGYSGLPFFIFILMCYNFSVSALGEWQILREKPMHYHYSEQNYINSIILYSSFELISNHELL